MPVTHRLFIQRLRIPTMIGLHPCERFEKQMVCIDLEAVIPPVKEDCIENTVDIDSICKLLCSAASKTHFNLLESLGEYFASLLVSEFNLRDFKLRVYKHKFIWFLEQHGVLIEYKS